MKKIGSLMLLIIALSSCAFNDLDENSDDNISISEEVNNKIDYTLIFLGHKYNYEKELLENVDDLIFNLMYNKLDNGFDFYIFNYDYYIDKELTTIYDPIIHQEVNTIYVSHSKLSHNETTFDYIYNFVCKFYDVDMSYELYKEKYYDDFMNDHILFKGFDQYFTLSKSNGIFNANISYFVLQNGEYLRKEIKIPLNKYYVISTDNYKGSCMIYDDSGIVKEGDNYYFNESIDDGIYIDLSDLTIYDKVIENVNKDYKLTAYSYKNGIYGNQLLYYIENHSNFDFSLGHTIDESLLENYEKVIIDDTHFYIQIENKKYYFDIETYNEHSYYHIYKVESMDILFEGKNYQETLRILNILFGSNGLKDFCVEVILNEDCTFTLNVGYVVIAG